MRSSFIGLAVVVLYILVLSLLHYLNLIKLNMIGTINFVFISILMFALGVIMGKKALKKGYIEGLRVGGMTIASLFIMNILFARYFDLHIVLYYLVILASSTIGSMIGINLKR